MDLKGILPGDKVDIKILQEVNNEDDQKKVGTYMSSVFDIDEEDNFIFYMPTQAGKIVLLPLNVRYEFVFTTTNGLFKTEGMVIERYKKDNFYLMKGVVTSNITKFQRREYYRMECSIPLLFLTLDDEVGLLETMSEINVAIKDTNKTPHIRGLGTILDISGGGIRFISEKDLEDSNYLFLHFEVLVASRKSNIEVVGEIIEKKYMKDTEKFVYRIKFQFKDSKERERIIRFIFEEERRNRKKKLE